MTTATDKLRTQVALPRPSRGSCIPNAQRRREATDRITDAALTLFIRQGLDATSMEQIGQAAGMTKGSVYFYFNSKNGVLMHLLDRAEEVAVNRTCARVEQSSGSATDRLVAFLHSHAVIGEADARYMILIMLISIERPGVGGAVERRVTEFMARLTALVEGIIRQGQAEKVFRDDLDAHGLARMIMAVDIGCFVEWARRLTVDQSGAEFVRTMRRFTLAGLMPQHDTVAIPSRKAGS
ncbi:TetR/AcrR family transcriptional regulator [Mycobacterium sp. SM1]|uniref:TetR/AcrR family transcriptional regulator n=1 Tax=Mycobacterium sp. SM1 TaxID=2816243 RepID=UPI001BD08532|nr:TetR/AcrR family transcriptional regulator [Mycobacterium sp. SM1]MBS4730333.1 TetR/AcrR family transcriptional regulator [Mycobacterium sp. SM1]